MFTREEVLGGLPARRAHALLYLIETRVARLEARQREVIGFAALGEVGMAHASLGSLLRPSEDAERAPADPLVEYRATGEHDRPGAIRELEIHAHRWGSLVPQNPSLRATLAHLLAEKYRFTARQVPGIRAALGLDDEPVRQAYERLYGQALDTIYAPQVSLAERLRWALAAFGKRLNALPPFWFAFLVVLAMGIPQALLVLPIAVAAIGALPGIGLVLLGGALSLVTVAAISEAAARCGPLRYGAAHYGKLVAEFLGPVGAGSLTPMALTFFLIAAMAALIGAATTLADFTPLPAPLWAALLFGACLYLLGRGIRGVSLGVSVAVAILIALLLGLVSLLSVRHVQGANLMRAAPPVAGRPPGLEHLIGVVLMGYFIEAFVVQTARTVLPRDPSGRSLIWGSLAGLGAVAAALCGWVLVVNGAAPPEALAGERGTLFAPLAAVAGPGVAVLGSLLVLLLPGLVVLRCTIAAFQMVREWLPEPRRYCLVLPRDRCRLVVRACGAAPRATRHAGSVARGAASEASVERGARRAARAASFGLTYLGCDDVPCFRLAVQSDGGVRSSTLKACASPGLTDRWEIPDLRPSLSPELRRNGLQVAVEILAADAETVRLLVATGPGLTCEVEHDSRGLRLPDLVSLSDEAWRLLCRLMRRRETGLEELAAETRQPEAATARTLDGLAAAGLVERTEHGAAPRYRARFAPRRPGRLPAPIWEALEASEETPGARRQTPATVAVHWRLASDAWRLSVRRALFSERGRFLVAISPAVGAFLFTEWLLLMGRASFLGALGFIGVVTNTYITGVIPLMLILSCRRKGDVVPGACLRAVGNPLLVGGLYLVYLALLVYHGLYLWQAPWERAAALLSAVMTVGATRVMLRRGALAPRAVIELKEDLRGRGGAVPEARFSVMADGQPLLSVVRMEHHEGSRECHAASGSLGDPARLRSLTVSLPATPARELKLWTHRVTSEESSEPLPAMAEVRFGTETHRIDLGLCRGQTVLPIPPGACQVTLTLPEGSCDRGR